MATGGMIGLVRVCACSWRGLRRPGLASDATVMTALGSKTELGVELRWRAPCGCAALGGCTGAGAEFLYQLSLSSLEKLDTGS